MSDYARFMADSDRVVPEQYEEESKYQVWIHDCDGFHQVEWLGTLNHWDEATEWADKFRHDSEIGRVEIWQV